MQGREVAVAEKNGGVEKKGRTLTRRVHVECPWYCHDVANGGGVDGGGRCGWWEGWIAGGDWASPLLAGSHGRVNPVGFGVCGRA